MVRVYIITTTEQLFNKYPILLQRHTTVVKCNCFRDRTIKDAIYCYNCGKKYIFHKDKLNKDSIYDWADFDLMEFISSDEVYETNTECWIIDHMTTNYGNSFIKNGYMLKTAWVNYGYSWRNREYTGKIEVFLDLNDISIDVFNAEFNTFKEYFGDLGDIVIK